MHTIAARDAHPDRRAVEAVIAEISTAWDAGDAARFAGHFLTDAAYITFMGTYYRGSAEIRRTHEPLFASFLKGTTMFVEIIDISFPAPGVAIVVTGGDVAKRKPRRAPKVQAYTLVRTDAGWRVALFQNTLRKPFYEWIGFTMTPAMKPGGAAPRAAVAEGR